MLLFAQVEPLTQNVLGMFVVAFMVALVVIGGMIGIAVGVKNLLTKPATPLPPVVVTPPALAREDSPVTKAELQTAIDSLKQTLETLAKRETVTLLGSRVLNVEREVHRVDLYTRRSYHQLRNVLQSLVVGQAVIATKLGVPLEQMPRGQSQGDDIDDASDIDDPGEPT